MGNYHIDMRYVNDSSLPDISTLTGGNPNIAMVDTFAGASPSAKIQAAIDYAAVNTVKNVVLGDKDYYITSSITIKKGVHLMGGHGSSVTIGANVRGFTIEQNAKLTDLKINVDFSGYSKEVLYFDGIQKYYNTWNRTSIERLVLLNWTGVVSGIGIKLFAGATASEISFLNFRDIKIVSFSKGVYLQATNPGTGTAYINANRFIDFSIEDCIDMIVIEGSETIPYECSGNTFRNLQIQPTSNTLRIFTIQGQYNKLEGMLWDESNIAGGGIIATCKLESSFTDIDMKSLPVARYSNLGKVSNKFAT
jgi:hypothetical protein